MKLLLILLLIPSVVFALPTQVIDGKIVGIAPTAYTDGTPITEPMTFPIYCNNGSRAYVQSDQIGEPNTPELSIIGLPNGVYVCRMTAKTATGESTYSNAVNFTCSGLCISGQAPRAPTNLIINN